MPGVVNGCRSNILHQNDFIFRVYLLEIEKKHENSIKTHWLVSGGVKHMLHKGSAHSLLGTWIPG